jgi:hypothetical protein
MTSSGMSFNFKPRILHQARSNKNVTLQEFDLPTKIVSRKNTKQMVLEHSTIKPDNTSSVSPNFRKFTEVVSIHNNVD